MKSINGDIGVSFIITKRLSTDIEWLCKKNKIKKREFYEDAVRHFLLLLKNEHAIIIRNVSKRKTELTKISNGFKTSEKVLHELEQFRSKNEVKKQSLYNTIFSIYFDELINGSSVLSFDRSLNKTGSSIYLPEYQ